jgi:hypothetical protein
MIKRSDLRTGAQVFALWAGIIYLVIGVAGFAVTGFTHFAGASGLRLFGFELNPLHNLVHLVLGGAWVWAARLELIAKKMNIVLGVLLAVVSLVGFFGLLKFLAIEGAGSLDNYLHLVTAALAVYFGYTDLEIRRPATA